MEFIRKGNIILFLSLFLFNSCSPMAKATSQNTPPTQHQQVTQLTALLVGKLVLDENKCLRVITDNGGSPLIVWPPDYQATLIGDIVHVKEGLVSGIIKEDDLHIGDTVSFGGGDVNKFNIDDTFFQVSPKNCSGPYWVFAGLAQK